MHPPPSRLCGHVRNRGLRRQPGQRGVRGARWGARRRDGGSGPAGVPRVRLRGGRPGHRGRRRHPQEGRQAGQPRGRARGRPAAGVAHRHRAHPLGHPRRPDRPERPPAPGRRRPVGSDPQRHHRELRLAQGRPARRRRGVRLRDRHRGGGPPAGGHLRRGRRPHRGDAPGLQPARGRLHAARRARRPARHRRRRPPQLAAGGGHRRGRELPRLRRRGLHLAHPRGARARPGPDRHHHPRRGRRHRLRRQAGAGQGVPRRLGRRRRREGRLPELHGQGDPRPAARGGRHPPRPHRRARPAGARRAPDRRGRPACRRPRGRAGLRHLGVRGARGQVRDRALGPRPGGGRAVARVPLPRPDRERAHAGRGDLAVRRDDGHPDGGAVRPRAGRPGRRGLQHPRLVHPAREPGRALHPRRAGDRGRVHQGVPGPDHRLLPARAVPRRAARRLAAPRPCPTCSPSCT